MKRYQTLFNIQSQLSQVLSRCDRGIFVMFVISRVDGSRTFLSLSLQFNILTSYYFIQTNREQIGTIK